MTSALLGGVQGIPVPGVSGMFASKVIHMERPRGEVYEPDKAIAFPKELRGKRVYVKGKSTLYAKWNTHGYYHAGFTLGKGVGLGWQGSGGNNLSAHAIHTQKHSWTPNPPEYIYKDFTITIPTNATHIFIWHYYGKKMQRDCMRVDLDFYLLN